MRTAPPAPPVPRQSSTYGPAAMVRSYVRVPRTGPNRHIPGLPGRRPLGHRPVAQAVPAGRQRQAQRGGGAQVRLVEAAEDARRLGRVAHVEQVAGAVGRIGEPGQPAPGAGVGHLGLDREHVLRGQPRQPEPAVGRRAHRLPVEDRAARRRGQLGERGRPGLPAPEPDLGPRPERTRCPRGQVEEDVVGPDVEQCGPGPGFGFGQRCHPTIMMPNGPWRVPWPILNRPAAAGRPRPGRRYRGPAYRVRPVSAAPEPPRR